MSHETQLLQLLATRFPSLGGSEGVALVEELGLYAAGAWKAGPQRMAQHGVNVPAQLHEGLAQPAIQIASTGRGGTSFLSHLRQRWQNDEQFIAAVGALARLWKSKGTGRHQRPATGAYKVVSPAPGATQPDLQSQQSPGTGRFPGNTTGRWRNKEELEEPSESAVRGHTVDVAGFEVFEKLGEGNMGRVFKANQKSLDRVVALKVLNHSLAEEDETFVARFELEAKSAARLQHPNIVTVFDAGICPRTNAQFIAMELVEGESVGEIITNQGKLPEREALALCLAMTEALHCAEQHGIVHRDLKPDNILVGHDGIPRLTDLGLAKKREAKELTSAGLVVGTPHYMSPEQGLGVKDVDGRADLYSLGITLFHLLTGRVPFDSETAIGVITQHINDDVPDPRNYEPSITTPTAKLVSHLCARERDERYPTARAAGSDLQRCLIGQTPLGPEAAALAAEEADASSGRIRVGTVSGAFGGPGGGDGGLQPPDLTPPADLEPGDAALWRFLRTGFFPYLEEAEQAFKASLNATSGTAAAEPQAKLARAALLRGDAQGATKKAQAALEGDPTCRAALDVLAALDRGEATRASFVAGLSGLSAHVAAERWGDARTMGNRLRRDHPSEPHPHLLLAYVAARAKDEAAFRESIQLAWALYPSRTYLDVPLGNGTDLPAAQALIRFSRAALDSADPGRMLQTVQNTEDKSNLVAGAARMGIGVLHTVLADSARSAKTRRAHLFALSRGLLALQYLNHAVEVLARLKKLEPTPEEARAVEEDERVIAGLKGVAQQGIAPQRGRYPCPILKARGPALRQRLKTIERRRKEYTSEVDAISERLATIGSEDPRAQSEIKAAASALEREDPYAPIEEIDAELEQIASELQELSDGAPAEKSTGFFAKLKGAANAAGRAAKTGQLKVRETQLRTINRPRAVRALGSFVATALNTYGYDHPDLGSATRRARHLLACNERITDEVTSLKQRLETLGA